MAEYEAFVLQLKLSQIGQGAIRVYEIFLFEMQTAPRLSLMEVVFRVPFFLCDFAGLFVLENEFYITHSLRQDLTT